MKKIIAILISVLFLAGAAVSTSLFAGAVNNESFPFSDVPSDAWFREAVEYVREKGLMAGVASDRFDPNGNMNRAMIVTVLYRLEGEPKASGKCPFADLTQDWYRDAVAWAYDNSIVAGTSKTTFSPSNPLTREQIAAIFYRFIKFYKGGDVSRVSDISEYPDGGSVSDWATEAVGWAVAEGLIAGVKTGSVNYLKPRGNATRAQVATIMMRFVEKQETEPEPEEPSPSIGGVLLDSAPFYCDFMTENEKDDARCAIESAAGIASPAAESTDGAAIVVTVDPMLARMSYTLTEKDGKLILALPSPFNADHAAEILRCEFSKKEAFSFRSGFKSEGTFVLTPVSEAAGNIEFYGETDKNPLSYRTGEDVTFRISLLRGGRLVSAPRFVWQYDVDGGYSGIGDESGYSGQIVLTFSGNTEPGTGKLLVRAASKKGYPLSALGETRFEGSVFFDFGDIAPAVAEPDDFDEFWQANLASLDKVTPEILETCAVPTGCERDGWDVYSLKIRSSGDPACVNVTVPHGAEPNSLGIRADFQGYGVGSAGFSYDTNNICLSVNSHSIENNREDAYYSEMSAILDEFGFDAGSREECYFRDMLMRDVQSIRFAMSYFADLWDGVNVSVAGGSMGGFQSVAVAALCPAVSSVSTGITWMCDIGGDRAGRMTGWRPGYSEANSYYDTCYFAARVKCHVEMAGGLGDGVSVPSGLAAAYNAMKCEKSVSFTQNAYHGGNGGPNSRTYRIVGDAVPQEERMTILDTGVALPDPPSDDDRPLTDEEKAIKATTDQLKKARYTRVTRGNSDTLFISDFEAMIYSALTEQYGLDPGCTVSADPDCFAAFVDEYRNTAQGGMILLMLDYTVTGKNGGHVDSVARFMVTKDPDAYSGN